MIEQFGYRQELKRSVRLFDLVVCGLLVIVTTSPTTFGIVYNVTHGRFHWSTLVGLIAMMFTASSYAIISRVFPVAAGDVDAEIRGLKPRAGDVALNMPNGRRQMRVGFSLEQGGRHE
jgi:amino acid transporter